MALPMRSDPSGDQLELIDEWLKQRGATGRLSTYGRVVNAVGFRDDLIDRLWCELVAAYRRERAIRSLPVAGDPAEQLLDDLALPVDQRYVLHKATAGRLS